MFSVDPLHLKNNDGGGSELMLRVSNFVKNYTIRCANSQKNILLGVLIYKLKNYTAGYAIFIHKGLH